MKRTFLASSASILVMMAAPAMAQNAQSSDAARAAEANGDIVVTATRSETLLSKTPIALTAISGDGLRDAGVSDARALADVVPNLAITENGDGLRISIRGITSTDGTEKGDPSAAFLLDGIYIARPQDQQGAFFDVERVEVLRGPQGTLYGRNTTAGVVNVITARPGSEFGGSVDGQYASRNTVNVTGVVNVPLSESLGVRLAANYDRADNNLSEGVAGPYSINPAREIISTRLTFGGELGDLSFVIRGDYSQQKGSMQNSLPLNVFFPGTYTPTVNPLYVDNGSDVQTTLPYALAYPSVRDNEFYGVMGEFNYSLGSVDLTYVGSYRESKRSDVREFMLFGSLQNPATFTGDFQQQSHELRAAFGADSPLHGQIGGYFFREESSLELNIGAPLSQIVGGANAVGFAFPQGPTVARSIAGFGQLTYDLTDDLHISVGGRYTSDDKSRNGATVVDTRNVNTGVITRTVINENIASRGYNKFTWRAGIDYDVPGLGLVYASVSTGYKAGGFNDGCLSGAGVGCSLTASALYYDPETLTAYEGGFKFRLMDNALRLNASVFHYDYSGLQISQLAIVSGVPATLIRNAATAKIDGVELEAVVNPGDNTRFDFGFTYTNSRYTNFVPDSVNYPTFSFNGLPLDHAPELTASAGITQTIPLGNGGEIEASARTRLSSAYYMQDLNNLSQFRQPAFTKTDLTLTYNAPERAWFVQGFVKNLENEITLAAANSGTFSSATIETPRTFGVRAGIRF